jgi:hypothetical protein
MTKFEDQLYADLMRQHGSVLAATAPPAPPRRGIASRGVLLTVGAGGIAVAATASVLATGGGTGTPDYALTTNHDTITLAVYQESGIAQANARLRQLGDHVVVVPVRAGCPSLGSLPAPAVRAKDISVGGSRSSDGSITVNAHGVPAGDILVVAVEVTAQGTQAAAGLTSPPAPICVSLPALPPGTSRPGPGTRDPGSGTVGRSSGTASSRSA